jgi:threonine/homoserine/homoserine lactone efflux protein
MNYQLFSAYLLITFVLVIVPGRSSRSVIATGASRGIRAALVTVAERRWATPLLACIAFGLNGF